MRERRSDTQEETSTDSSAKGDELDVAGLEASFNVAILFCSVY